MNRFPVRIAREKTASFTLVEMLVALGVLLIMLLAISAISLEVTRAWKNTSGTIEGFRDSRAAFESMTRTISHATLNTYFDYVNASGTFRYSSNAASFVPVTYDRRSDLEYVSGTTNTTLLNTIATQIPNPITHAIFFFSPRGETSTAAYTGLNGTLNACGYYVTYTNDPTVPTFLSATTVPKLYRYRLMQFMEPTENVSVYDTTQVSGKQWYLLPISAAPTTCVSQLAENVVALIIQPTLTPDDVKANQSAGLPTVIATNYDYDTGNSADTTSYNQLPPEVNVTMVVIDEASALKLGNTTTAPNLLQGSSFATAAQYQSDLTNLENNLSAAPGNAAGNHIPLHFRVFRTEVALVSAKWSQ